MEEHVATKEAPSPKGRKEDAEFARRGFIKGALFAGTGVIVEGSIAAVASACGRKARPADAGPDTGHADAARDADIGQDAGSDAGPDSAQDGEPDSAIDAPSDSDTRDADWDPAWGCRTSDSSTTAQVHLGNSLEVGGIRVMAADMEFDMEADIYAAILDISCVESGEPVRLGARVALYATETFEAGMSSVSITCNGLISGLSMNLTVSVESPL